MVEEIKEKKIIPFKKAIAIFVVWALLLSGVGCLTYKYVLKKYIIDRPYIIKVEKPKEDKK